MSAEELTCVADTCTLPTVERPLRLAEFDELFAGSLRTQVRLRSTRLQWKLDPDAESAARDLTRRETSCCSFFSFTFAQDEHGLDVAVDVPAAYADVLDALEARAESAMAAGAST